MDLPLVQTLLKPLAAPGLHRGAAWALPVLPTPGPGSAFGSGGVKERGRPGDEGSRKRGDALGSISGSEEEVWWSRCPSARQDVCPAASPGQDTSLCAFPRPAKGVR